MRNIKWAYFIVIEKLLRWAVSPYLRAWLLSFFGAKIGINVRIYETKFINIADGFKNFYVEDSVHIGPDTLIDLAEKVFIGKNSTLSPRVTIFTHSDPGSKHDSSLLKEFPREEKAVSIAEDVWVGANTVILAGSEIGKGSVIGACSMVKGIINEQVLACGIPAKGKRNLSQ